MSHLKLNIEFKNNALEQTIFHKIEALKQKKKDAEKAKENGEQQNFGGFGGGFGQPQPGQEGQSQDDSGMQSQIDNLDLAAPNNQPNEQDEEKDDFKV